MNQNNTISVTDANGNAMTYGYDDLNRWTSTTNAAGETSTTTFDDAGNVLTSTNPRGNVTTYTYDLRNRVTQVADSLGVISQTTFDNAGRRLTQTDGNGNTVSFTYDNAGRVTATTDALGNSSATTFDDVGNVLTTTDREGHVTTHVYDDLNRRVATTDALGNTTSYDFDDVGNLLAITDARGNVTSYTYDNLNRRITETYPDAAPNTKSFTYDAVGNLLTKTDQKGQVQTHAYDDLYRLLTRSTPGWPADTFTYDVGGRMLTATRAGWVVSYTYDVANRVTQTTQGGRTIGYSYNIPAGTRTITYPGGRVITEQQDLRSRLSGVKEGAVNIATYSYDNGNRVDTRTYQNGVVADYTYDANNRITELTHIVGQAPPLAAFRHEYDREGNKKNEEKLHQTGASEAYAYDSIYRLVDYKVGPLVAGTVPVPVTQTAYSLDAVGNWDSKTTDAVTQTRTHNAANEITQIDTQAINHDANGNLIQDANYDYSFDENNRLIQVVSPQSIVVSQYSYDALGRRISKTVGPAVTVFYYDNARIIEERDGSNNVQATYTFGNYIDEVLTKDAGASRYFYHQNTLWSVHALTDAAGAVVERYTYDAYGAPQILTSAFGPLTSSAFGNRIMFTGREWDAECSLYHYRARTYGPGLGRFYSRDPLEYVDGINLYEYARSNTNANVDPSGKEALPMDVLENGNIIGKLTWSKGTVGVGDGEISNSIKITFECKEETQVKQYYWAQLIVTKIYSANNEELDGISPPIAFTDHLRHKAKRPYLDAIPPNPKYAIQNVDGKKLSLYDSPNPGDPSFWHADAVMAKQYFLSVLMRISEGETKRVAIVSWNTVKKKGVNLVGYENFVGMSFPPLPQWASGDNLPVGIDANGDEKTLPNPIK
jgi:RHS repeat-associated protein